MGDLGPLAGGIHDIVRVLAAISVGHRGKQPASVVAAAQQNLGDAGELFANDVGVLFRVSAKLVKVNLLVKVGVFGGPFISLWKARVVEAGIVGFPGEAAAGSGKVHSGDDVREFLAGGDFKNVRGTVLGTVFRQGGGHVFAAERRHIEIHGERSLGVGGVGIEDDFRAGRIIR